MSQLSFARLTRLAFAIALFAALVPTAPARAQSAAGNLLVYHQITNLPDDHRSVGYPVLSAGGERAVFANAPGTGDAATPNRVFVIGADGQGLTEVDAYQTLCYCGAYVDIDGDGDTVVSSDSVQLRLVAGGGSAIPLVTLSSNELSAPRLTAAGDRVFFVVGRDSALAASTVVLQRGIYVVEADGTGLEQVAGPEAIGELLGMSPDAIGPVRLGEQVLDVSDDGSRLVFSAYAGPHMAVFTVQADGSDLRQVVGPVQYAPRVAISGDGSLIAYDMTPLDVVNNEIVAAPFGGGAGTVLASPVQSGWSDPIQLTRDGGRLLISPNSLLIDTETGETRVLSIPVSPFGGNHLSTLADGLPRATMNAEATRFLYAMRTARCADCANLSEELATLDIGPVDLGAAPAIDAPEVSPATIPVNYVPATVTATIATGETLLGVALHALRDGLYDINVGRDAMLFDDGTAGDAVAGDGVFTNNNVYHSPVVTREDDTGPRTLRVAAEIETSDGFRHATAVDFGPLTVTAT